MECPQCQFENAETTRFCEECGTPTDTTTPTPPLRPAQRPVEGPAAWQHFTAEQFLAGYSAADAVYDEI